MRDDFFVNAEQYKRANNNSFYVTIIIIVSGLFLTIFSLVQYGANIGRMANMYFYGGRWLWKKENLHV